MGVMNRRDELRRCGEDDLWNALQEAVSEKVLNEVETSVRDRVQRACGATESATAVAIREDTQPQARS
jgi:hypothetical protein